MSRAVHSARAGLELSEKYGIETPIIRAVGDVLFENKSPRLAVDELMQRGKERRAFSGAVGRLMGKTEKNTEKEENRFAYGTVNRMITVPPGLRVLRKAPAELFFDKATALGARVPQVTVRSAEQAQ